MSTTNREAAKPISELETGPMGETVITREQTANSSQVAEPAAAKAAGRRNPGKPANGTLVERQFQRRNNINSLPGLIREHARLIALMRTGEISLDKAEVMSRAYSRHREMVSALEQRTQLEAIQQQLAALRGEPSGQFLIDEAPAKEPKT
jgi:hypothetical protein